MEDGNLSLRPVPSAISISQTFSPPREAAFIVLVCMAQFMTQTNVGVCLSPLDIIGDSFGIDDNGILSWFLAGYSLTVGTFILIFGRCGDLFGYRRIFLSGFIWLAIWSLVAGVSVYSNYYLFIIARVMQGLGSAMLLPNGLAILGATYPPGKKKAMLFALFGAVAPNSALLGTVFSAIFAQLAWWPWTFWVQSIVSIACAVLGFVVVPSIHHDNPQDTSNLFNLLKALDALGAFCGIGGLILVNIAWNQAPVAGWSTPYVYVLLIVGILLIAGFFLVEFRYAEHPLIPFHAFSQDVSFVLGCVACGWGAFGTWIWYFWRFEMEYRHTSPLLGSAQFVPVAPMGILACFVTGLLITRMRPGWIMVMSMSAFTLGNIFTAIAPVNQTYWALTFVCLLVIPWGMDMSFPAATLMLSNSVERKHQGIAASLVTTIVNYSISLSLGFAGTVEAHVNNGGTTRSDVLKGYRGALYFSTGLGGLGIVLSVIFTLKCYREEWRSKSVDEKISEDGSSSSVAA
ncbi:Drug resistance protein [Penicillium macrosclerotiorum]|uniref:Drug resistance protein n=1 Tax=Penicillium macrosclerotiorum TaxID=303699 RepID=UPI00254874D5|nr:Drug resistance protein [Penicillium macrosclerotiorum]KAJ5690422.1 Drug resistance protein [Penicillium macrosclerotiorum]